MPDRIVFELDDWTTPASAWAFPLLKKLYEQSGERLRVTLFTIPAQYTGGPPPPWIEIAAHGWDHSPEECKTWTKAHTLDILGKLDPDVYAKVFKAPFWITSEGLYEGLLEAGWSIADHPQNVLKIPRELKRYVLGPNHVIGAKHNLLPLVQAHGHVPDVCNNGLRESFVRFDALRHLGLEYAFISEVVQ